MALPGRRKNLTGWEARPTTIAKDLPSRFPAAVVPLLFRGRGGSHWGVTIRELTLPARQVRAGQVRSGLDLVVHGVRLLRPLGGNHAPGRLPQRLDRPGPGCLVVGVEKLRSPAAGLGPPGGVWVGNGAKRAFELLRARLGDRGAVQIDFIS